MHAFIWPWLVLSLADVIIFDKLLKFEDRFMLFQN